MSDQAEPIGAEGVVQEMIAVCSARPRPSVQNSHSKGSQWWRRDVYHLREIGSKKRTRCGHDCSDWLVIGQIHEVDDNCCKRCLARVATRTPDPKAAGVEREAIARAISPGAWEQLNTDAAWIGAGERAISLVAAGRVLTVLRAVDAAPGGGVCELCAGKCRGHRLGHPEEWHPEPGSRAFRATPTAAPAPNVQALVKACEMLLWFQRHEHAEVSEAHEAWDALDAALAAIQAHAGEGVE